MNKLLTTVAALVLVTGCNVTQPPPPCLAAHGSYAVAYTNTAGTPTGTCALTYSIVGVQKYNQVEEGVLPKLAIRPIEIGWNDGAPETIAIGTFKAAGPDDESWCYVDTFDNASVSGTLSYTYSNVKLYVNSKAAGTQMSFDVVVTDTDPASLCTATYHANAVWPVVACAFLDAAVDPADANCAGVDFGWSYLALNPDFDVKCEVDPNDWIGQWNGVNVGAFCVPRNDVPSFCPEGGCTWRPTEE